MKGVTTKAFTVIDYADWGGNAEIQLYWKTSTVSNQTIPAENLSVPYDVASTPILITVNCPTGYTIGGSSMNKCATLCGDGFVYDSEKCDDANTVNGDGCSSDCTLVEDGWICLNGSKTHKSDCLSCTIGYQPNTIYSECKLTNYSSEVSILLVIFWSIFLLREVLNFISIFKGLASIQSSFSGINQIQLILLLPLVGGFIPIKVVRFIAGMNVALNPLSYFYLDKIAPGDMNVLNYEQADSYFKMININSGSSMLNLLNFLYPILLVFIFHSILAIIIILFNENSQNCFQNVILKLFRWITFGIYVRIVMIYYLFLLMISFSELYNFRFNNNEYLASKVLSVFLLLFCNIIAIACTYLIFATKTEANTPEKRRWFIHCFKGLKESKFSRFHTLLFYTRRQLFCVLILFCKDFRMIAKIITYASMQFIYIVILCINRPFKNRKEFVIDLINELIYFSLCILLIHYNSEDRWSSKSEYAYIWIIISNNIVLLLFETIYCFKFKKKDSIVSTPKILPDGNLIINVINNLNKREETKDYHSSMKINEEPIVSNKRDISYPIYNSEQNNRLDHMDVLNFSVKRFNTRPSNIDAFSNE